MDGNRSRPWACRVHTYKQNDENVFQLTDIISDDNKLA